MLQVSVQKQLGSRDTSHELNVQFDLAAGDVLALSGPSGVGKTTLLRLLAGLDAPDRGVIRYGEQLWLDSATPYTLPTAQRRVGFVFQDYALFPHLSVHDNLRYGQREADPDAIDNWLQQMELTALARRYPHQLSGGQRQRLALARALIGKPQLLLLDEPLSALDAKLRYELQHRLAQALQSQPTTTILVSHDSSEIFRLAHRVLQWRSDAPPRLGTPTELLLGPLTPGRCTLHATVLALLPADMMVTAVVSVGHDHITTLITQAEANALHIGMPVRVELNGTSAVLHCN